MKANRSWLGLMVLVFVLMVSMSAYAAEQVTLIAGSGSKGGTYYPVMQQIGQFCDSPTMQIQEYTDAGGNPIGGSTHNLRNLLTNKISIGIIQNDVVHLEKMNNAAAGRLEAVIPLHKEALHFLVPMQVRTTVVEKPSGLDKYNPFAKDKAVTTTVSNPLTEISQLAGKRVAAWGGSATSAKVVKLIDNLSFEIVQTKDETDAISRLNNGSVDAILAVVGAPAKWIDALPKGQYKLLSVAKADLDHLKDIYSTTDVSYDNLGTNGQAIQTLAVDSILFTRVYHTPSIINAIGELQSCVKKKIYTIQDTPGTHPVWQTIDPNREVKWDRVFSADKTARK